MQKDREESAAMSNAMLTWEKRKLMGKKWAGGAAGSASSLGPDESEAANLNKQGLEAH